jgi:hypothetical protein
MKYTIQEILPGQIRVEYEDNSWAIVPISANSTMEEIDRMVAQYDPDFLQEKSLLNSNIKLGEERVSVFEDNKNLNPFPPIIQEEEVLNIISPNQNLESPQVQNIFGNANLLECFIVSNYFSERGDNQLKDSITNQIEKYVSESTFSLEKLIDDSKNIFESSSGNKNFQNIDSERLYNLALEELDINMNNENTNIPSTNLNYFIEKNIP